MKKDFLSKVKGAILTKEEAKTIAGGYSGTGNNCFFVCCPTVFPYSQTGGGTYGNGCNDSRYSYIYPSVASGRCVKC
jgi:hypothetical protein